MTLECRDDRLGVGVERARDRDAVAVHRQHGFQGLNRLALVAACKEAAVADRRGTGPMADAGVMQPFPRKALTGIHLAARRDVGMGQHGGGRERPAIPDVAAEPADMFYLGFSERRESAVVSWVGDLDADRAGVDV